jgi:hypothetical protein
MTARPEYHVSMLDSALEIARRGWPVFPCNPVNKRPLTQRGFKDATTDENITRQWWRDWPNAMIGVPMGEASGVFCVDLDRKEDGADGIATWNDLVNANSACPETRQHITPSTGMHLVFLHEAGVRNIPLNKIAPGIEVKGEGGYIVVPPSRMLDGRGYTGNDIAATVAPAWFMAKMREYWGDGGELDDELRQDAGKGIYRDDDFIDFPATDPDEIKEMLRHIPADDYDTWFRVVGAIYKELGDSGFWLFDEWSRKSKKYSSRDVKRKWKDASKITNISAGTIYHMAEEFSPGCREKYRKRQNNGPAQTKVPPKDKPLVLSNSEFIAEYKPPSYIISGLLQRRFVYSLTGPTGSGKTCVTLRIAAHVITGTELNGRKVKKGKVLYFAGENPDDVRVRWIKLCEDMKIDPKNPSMFWLPGVPPLKNKDILKRIYEATLANGPFSLVIIDTSAAYFQGDDENSNTQLGEHARLMRRFTGLPGNPVVLVTCHPTKHPDLTNLLPRGGGAFLAEMDGNLACIRDNFMLELTTHGKWRGPDFSPLAYKLHPCKLDKLVDEDGDPIWSVITVPIGDAEQTSMEDAMEKRREELMKAMFMRPGLSLAEYASELNWIYADGKPNKSLMQRMLNKLVMDKVVEKRGGHYALTKKAAGTMRETTNSKGTTESMI